MPRAPAARRKVRRVKNKKGRGGVAGKARRARGPSRRKMAARRARSRKRGSRGGAPRRPAGFFQDIARVMFPHEAETPCRWPDGQGLKTVAMNVVTTRTITNRGATSWDIGTNLGPSHSSAILCTPGSIHCPLWLDVEPKTAAARPTSWTTNATGTPTFSSMFSASGAMGTNSDFSRYRVTGATLKITYIGNADDAGGEFTVQKFNPRPDVWNSITDAQTADNEPAIPTSADMQQFDMRVERIPSRLGCFLGFAKSSAAQYGSFKDLENAALTTATFVAAESPAIASLEACVVYITGTKPSEVAGLNESKGQWRIELVQSVELVPKTASLLNKIATPAPSSVPLFHQAYENLHEMIAAKNLDIVPAARAQDLRNLAVSGAYAAAGKASASLGHSIPTINVDPVGKTFCC